MPKNLKLVSIHDVLTSREVRSDPTVSRDHVSADGGSEPERPPGITPDSLRKPASRRRGTRIRYHG